MLYRNFSNQDEIDREYNPRLRVEQTDQYLTKYLSESERVSKTLNHQDGIQYGPTLNEVLDYYPSSEAQAPLVCFIHGGYWHAFSSRDFAFITEALHFQGFSVAHINYSLCPEVTLDEIVRQCRAALAWLFRNADALGFNPEKIGVAGHSAGGHLTGMLLATNWEHDYGLPSNLIRAAFPISGLFDLRPFPFSWLQPKLQFNLEQVMRNSPLFLECPGDSKVKVLVGGDESEEFQRQSSDYSKHLRKQGIDTDFTVIQIKHHFNLLDDFLGKGGEITQLITQTMNPS